jgi:hypothetical protein
MAFSFLFLFQSCVAVNGTASKLSQDDFRKLLTEVKPGTSATVPTRDEVGTQLLPVFPVLDVSSGVV